MRVDKTSIKMAYEAARDSFLGFYEPTCLSKAPEDVPRHLHHAYEMGRKQRMRETMAFFASEPAVVPIEFDGQFIAAWTGGYECGKMFGSFYGSMLLEQVLGLAR